MMKRNPRPRGPLLTALLISTLGLACGLWAQQAAPLDTPAAPTTPTEIAEAPVAAPVHPVPDPKIPQDDRIFWTLPNFLTVENASTMPPLTTGQKFKLDARDTFDPVMIALIGLEAGIYQASNSNPTFGQGLKGYSKRYALAFADNAIGNMMTSAAFPALFHQDMRFYQMGKGGFLHRAWYAGTRVVVTRSDAGITQFNWSEFIGNGVAAGISNAYHPGPRTLGSNVNVWATQIGWDAFSYELKEFWPDIHHMLARRHH
jgi:hypothetical protein